MIKGYLGREKVNAKVKPLPSEKRTVPELITGGDYYISFGLNNAYPCKLVEVVNKERYSEVTVSIPTKVQSKKGFRKMDGTISHDWRQEHTVYPNEIGLTPEHAVRNTVM